MLHKITITVKYLPRVLDLEADRKSRDFKNSSEWKLDPQVFKKMCLARGFLDMDLCALRVSHQMPPVHVMEVGPIQQW